MKLAIVWLDAALEDMQTIFRQIMQDSPQGALLVDDRINTQIELLSDFPLAGRTGLVAETRELVIGKTSYLVVYRLEDEAVRIVRILHDAQERPLQV